MQLWCLFVGVVLAVPAFSQNIDMERTRAKWMLKTVAGDLEKNFYDPQMRGLDWKALYAQTIERIEKAATVNQVYLSIFSMVDKLDDSHTIFLPPQRAARPMFGFKAKAYGDAIYIYDIRK